MNFWRKKFNPSEPNTSENYFLKQKEEQIDHYANSWVNNEIPELDRPIAELIYRFDLNEKIIDKYLDFGNDSDYSDSAWSAKGELNFPGPFYTGESDTCGTGIIESPNNVIFNKDCTEFVMIQPRNKNELLQLWNAGAVEVFGSYYCDGNKHWTLEKVKNWWENKNDILKQLENEELIKMNCNQEKRYRHYIDNFAEMDLRKYGFFLENGFYPSNESLPEIKR